MNSASVEKSSKDFLFSFSRLFFFPPFLFFLGMASLELLFCFLFIFICLLLPSRWTMHRLSQPHPVGPVTVLTYTHTHTHTHNYTHTHTHTHTHTDSDSDIKRMRRNVSTKCKWFSLS